MVAPFHFKHTLRELPGSAVEEKCPAVEETSHAVEESSHGGLLTFPDFTRHFLLALSETVDSLLRAILIQ